MDNCVIPRWAIAKAPDGLSDSFQWVAGERRHCLHLPVNTCGGVRLSDRMGSGNRARNVRLDEPPGLSALALIVFWAGLGCWDAVSLCSYHAPAGLDVICPMTPLGFRSKSRARSHSKGFLEAPGANRDLPNGLMKADDSSGGLLGAYRPSGFASKSRIPHRSSERVAIRIASTRFFASSLRRILPT